MTEDTGQKDAELDTQQSAVPTEEQKTSQGAKEIEGAQDEVSSSQKSGGQLQDEVSERTREQFEKLQGQLKSEREQKEYLAQVLNRANQAQVEQVKPIIDPDTGLVDEVAIADLQKQVIESRKTATQAQRAVSEYLVKQEEQEMVASHPELDSNSKTYDKNLRTLAEGIYYHSMVNPQEYDGRQLSPKEAADMAKKLKGTVSEEGKKRGAEEADKAVMPKEQASLEAKGTPSRRGQVEDDLADLKYRTRRGDKTALIERLRRAGFIKAKE